MTTGSVDLEELKIMYMQNKTMEKTEENRIHVRPQEKQGYTILEDNMSETGYRQVENVTLIEWYNEELVNMGFLTPCQIRNIVFNVYKMDLNGFIEDLMYKHIVFDIYKFAQNITKEILDSLRTDPVHNKKEWSRCIMDTSSEVAPGQKSSVIDYNIKKTEIEYDILHHDDIEYYIKNHSEQWADNRKNPKKDYVLNQVMRFLFEYIYQYTDVNYVQEVARKFKKEELHSWKVDQLQYSPYGKAFDAKNPNPRVI